MAIDYNAPLLWEHEDGRTGIAVRDVPHEGRVYFFDSDGPVGRFDDIAECRWSVLRKTMLATGRETYFRTVRIVDRDGGKHYLIPGHVGVVDCAAEHGCRNPVTCVEVDRIVSDMFQAGA